MRFATRVAQLCTYLPKVYRMIYQTRSNPAFKEGLPGQLLRPCPNVTYSGVVCTNWCRIVSKPSPASLMSEKRNPLKVCAFTYISREKMKTEVDSNPFGMHFALTFIMMRRVIGHSNDGIEGKVDTVRECEPIWVDNLSCHDYCWY